MAALILKVEVVDENRLNVVWKHQDIYEEDFFHTVNRLWYNRGACFTGTRKG